MPQENIQVKNESKFMLFLNIVLATITAELLIYVGKKVNKKLVVINEMLNDKIAEKENAKTNLETRNPIESIQQNIKTFKK